MPPIEPSRDVDVGVRATPDHPTEKPAQRTRVRAATLCFLLGMALGCVGTAPLAHAHPLAPALLEIKLGSDGQVDVLWRTSRLRPRGLDLQPRLPPDCTAIQPPQTTGREASIDVRSRLQCESADWTGRTIGVDGIEGSRIDVLLRLVLPDRDTVVSSILSPRNGTLVVPPRQTPGEVLLDYLELGALHIATGLDHLAFVLGLLLLIGPGGPLVRTITAFTLGHSLTLSAAALGFVRFPSAVIELLIAASVLCVALELARAAEATPSLLRRRPWLVALVFGLLHGMGFAGALAEVGLPPDEIPTALLAFNVGIEIGQLAFVASVLSAWQLIRKPMPSPPPWLARIPTYAIGGLASYWCIERFTRLL